MPFRAGFTLVELLLVIVLLAILATLLLPSLGSAKARARQTQCLSDLGQWGLAMNMYTMENDDRLPRERGAKGTSSWPALAAETNRDVWCNALPGFLSKSCTADYAASPASRGDFYLPDSFFACPSARFPDDAVKNPLFSRAMNSKLIVGTTPMKLTLFTEPSRTPVFLEAGVTGEPKEPSQEIHDGRSYVKWDHSSVRHRRSGNVTFADGHAALVPAAELTNEAPRQIRWDPVP